MKKIKGICLVIFLLFGMTACEEKEIREPEGVVTGEVFRRNTMKRIRTIIRY